LDSKVRYGSFDDKREQRSAEWLKTHTLSKEQVAQLIRNKIERAKVYQLKEGRKCFFDD
jgi:hypothetical protein